MHLSDEQKAKKNAEIFARKFNQVLAHKDEIAEQQHNAAVIFAHFVASPTWDIAEAPRPPAPWTEPEEIWSETPKVVRK
jgi:hypothetical protein